jgi:Brp/Blh family beta-carotene 15,15'-monooxygenase
MTTLDTAQGTMPDAPTSAWVIARYTWFIGGATLAFTLAIAVFGSPSEMAAALFMLVAVALVGLPHGAYDLEVARRLFAPRFGRRWWIGFGVAYLALALFGVLIWVSAPVVGLALLLVGGAAHWGLDDLHNAPRSRTRTAWLAVSRGSIPVAAPMAFHADAVTPIFVGLLGSPVNTTTVQLLGVLWLLAGAPGVIASFWSKTPHRFSTTLRIIAEPVVLLLLFAVVPPILAFTVYFCFWHAVRHSLRSALRADANAALDNALLAYARAAAFPTVLTWLLAGVAAALLLGDTTTIESAWAITFIGLFALTIPHVALEFIEHRGFSVSTESGGKKD